MSFSSGRERHINLRVSLAEPSLVFRLFWSEQFLWIYGPIIDSQEPLGIQHIVLIGSPLAHILRPQWQLILRSVAADDLIEATPRMPLPWEKERAKREKYDDEQSERQISDQSTSDRLQYYRVWLPVDGGVVRAAHGYR
ncbi:unnamed protein product [Alternaria alternata]